MLPYFPNEHVQSISLFIHTFIALYSSYIAFLFFYLFANVSVQHLKQLFVSFTLMTVSLW